MNDRYNAEVTPTELFDRFGFNTVPDRSTTPSSKWGVHDADVLPMWIADMDFRSPPAVINALHSRVDHGIFGYERAPADLLELIVERLAHLYDWRIGPEAIVFLPGIVPGFNLATRAFVGADEGVMIQTPVYMHIVHAAADAGVQSHAMTLTQEPAGHYIVDMDLFERTVRSNTRLFLLCNPHNPVGRVFTRGELEAMAEACLRHEMLICSDEIHCDLVFSGHQHIPIAALDPEIEARTVTLMAPSKTFNIAGLHCGYAIIPNADLRRRYRQARGGLVRRSNSLGLTAAKAAYAEGALWLRTLLAYLEGNRDLMVRYLAEHLPQLSMASPEGTYLAWINCRGAGLERSPERFFLERGRVALNGGADFGPGGEGFVRLNFGCPRDLMLEGLRRMCHALS